MEEHTDETIIAVARYLKVAPWELAEHPEWVGRTLRVLELHQERKRKANDKVEKFWRDWNNHAVYGNDGVPIPRVDAVSRTKVCS